MNTGMLVLSFGTGVITVLMIVDCLHDMARRQCLTASGCFYPDGSRDSDHFRRLRDDDR
ncbi:hypothetical protein [Kribbella albertanoniae]|uniref:hypothetical protein n=1 Tax=Kribbella albertanoniae TaxID=1266829 RepID=UPI00140464E8|nr:hypothetical protein [Kribbella albertanoniae]